MKKIAIVGSRRRRDEDTQRKILEIVSKSDIDDVFISGGAKGPDTYCRKACKVIGRVCIEFKADISFNDHPFLKWLYANAKFQRNKSIAGFCDICYAAVASDRKGGTEDTIKQCEKLEKEIILI